MKKRTSGFAALLVIGIVAVASLAFAGYEYFHQTTPKLGAVVYTTQLTDTLGTFRNQVNSSTANLNTQLNALSSTVSTYGNVVTLNTPIGVIYGGTGTTTLPSNAQFLSASGTSPAWKTFTFGAGLLSTTTPTSVSISTQGLDVTANYAWTGSHSFASTTTYTAAGTVALNGTTTVGGNTTFNVFPTVATTSPTSSLQLAPKGYVDNMLPSLTYNFVLASSSVSAGQSGVTTGTFSSTTISTSIIAVLHTWNCSVSGRGAGGSVDINISVNNTSSPSTVWSGTAGESADTDTITYQTTATFVTTSTGVLYFQLQANGSANTAGNSSISCTPYFIKLYH